MSALQPRAVQVWWVTMITPGGYQGWCPAASATGAGATRAPWAPGTPSTSLHPNTAEQGPSSPLRQKGFTLLSAFTQSTHTFSFLPISGYDSLYPHLVGLNCSNSILESRGEGSKWKNRLFPLRRKKISHPSLRGCKGQTVVSFWRTGLFGIEGISDFTRFWKGKINVS